MLNLLCACKIAKRMVPLVVYFMANHRNCKRWIHSCFDHGSGWNHHQCPGSPAEVTNWGTMQVQNPRKYIILTSAQLHKMVGNITRALGACQCCHLLYCTWVNPPQIIHLHNCYHLNSHEFILCSCKNNPFSEVLHLCGSAVVNLHRTPRAQQNYGTKKMKEKLSWKLLHSQASHISVTYFE